MQGCKILPLKATLPNTGHTYSIIRQIVINTFFALLEIKTVTEAVLLQKYILHYILHKYILTQAVEHLANLKKLIKACCFCQQFTL